MKRQFGIPRIFFAVGSAAFHGRLPPQLHTWRRAADNVKTWRWFLAVLLPFAAGCSTLQQIANDLPPAKTPVLTRLQAAPSVTGTYADVAMDQGFTPGAFQVISIAVPTGVPRGAIKVFFTAPWTLTLKVDVEGTVLNKFAEVPPGLDPNVVGYYRVESVDASENWQVTIHPPLSSVPRFALTINIATVSTNPKYANGTDHESAPLVIKLSAKPFIILLDAQGFLYATCVLVPHFPQLRAGLTVFSADNGANSMVVVDCCAGFTARYGARGEWNSVAPVSFPFPMKRKYSLVLRIGTQSEQGGAGERFVTNQAGALEACVNDDNLHDNHGQWGVIIRVFE